MASAYLNQGRIAAFCRHKWIVQGGQISILIWLLHIPVLRYWQYLVRRIGIGVDFRDSLAGFCVSFSLILLAAWICTPVLRRVELVLTQALLRWTSVSTPQIPNVN